VTEQPSPVPDLEKRVADAAAELARLQAELSQARAADPNLPDVPTPYQGQAPVVLINGQDVPATQSFTIPPVVSVNGQVVSAGQPIDLGALMGPAAAQQVSAALHQFGFGGLLGAMSAGAAAKGFEAGMAAPSVSAPPGTQAYGLTAMGTPGELPAGNIALRWLVALVVLGLIGVLIYLSLTN
jgi:hypothetical protein